MALSRAEQRAEVESQGLILRINAVVGGLVCILSAVLSPQALERLQDLPDNLQPVEYLQQVLQTVEQNFSDQLVARAPIFAIGLAQLLFSINLLWEANKMKNSMFKNR